MTEDYSPVADSVANGTDSVNIIILSQNAQAEMVGDQNGRRDIERENRDTQSANDTRGVSDDDILPVGGLRDGRLSNDLMQKDTEGSDGAGRRDRTISPAITPAAGEVGRGDVSKKNMTPTKGMFEGKPETKAESPAAVFVKVPDGSGYVESKRLLWQSAQSSSARQNEPSLKRREESSEKIEPEVPRKVKKEEASNPVCQKRILLSPEKITLKPKIWGYLWGYL